MVLDSFSVPHAPSLPRTLEPPIIGSSGICIHGGVRLPPSKVAFVHFAVVINNVNGRFRRPSQRGEEGGREGQGCRRHGAHMSAILSE